MFRPSTEEVRERAYQVAATAHSGKRPKHLRLGAFIHNEATIASWPQNLAMSAEGQKAKFRVYQRMSAFASNAVTPSLMARTVSW